MSAGFREWFRAVALEMSHLATVPAPWWSPLPFAAVGRSRCSCLGWGTRSHVIKLDPLGQVPDDLQYLFPALSAASCVQGPFGGFKFSRQAINDGIDDISFLNHVAIAFETIKKQPLSQHEFFKALLPGHHELQQLLQPYPVDYSIMASCEFV